MTDELFHFRQPRLFGIPVIIMKQSAKKKATTLVASQLDASDSETQTTVLPQLFAPVPQNVTIKGNYLLGKKLGQGSFGKVHLAKHLPTGEKVAIKIIPKTNMTAKTQVRIKNELNILKSIRHRHIMELYQVLETEKSLLLATEHLPGGQLFHRILKEKKLSQQEACGYFQQLTSAVEYLHKNKIAHRDIKPQNVLIDEDRQIKLIDFGLSSSFRKKGTLSECSGSPCYAAPQIISGSKAYDPVKSDIWSCGVVLFVMLSGYLPFCDPNMPALFEKIKGGKYKIPSNLSAAAKNLIASILVVQPEGRMSFQDIKNHEWYSTVQPKKMYGVSLNEKMGVDKNLYENHQKTFEVSCEQMDNWLLTKEKNKHTATYQILIKKLVRQGELVPSYIGNCNFNPHFIISGEGQRQMIPEVEDIRLTFRPDDGPNVGCAYFGEPSAPELSENQLALLTVDTFQKVITPEPINPLEILLQFSEVSVVRQKVIEMKKSKFYANNMQISQGVNNMKKVPHQRDRSRDELASIYSAQNYMKRTKRSLDVRSSRQISKGRQLPAVKVVNRARLETSQNSTEKIARLVSLYGADQAPPRKVLTISQIKELKRSEKRPQPLSHLRVGTTRIVRPKASLN